MKPVRNNGLFCSPKMERSFGHPDLSDEQPSLLDDGFPIELQSRFENHKILVHIRLHPSPFVS
jgi:hypothetical protein